MQNDRRLMYLNPLDIACYIYCPILLQKKRHDKISPRLTFAEQYIRKAFIYGEMNACLKDSVITPRKLLNAWEKVWWPSVTAAGTISIKEAHDISLKASHKFTDYCKYDISDCMFPTAGVEAESDVKIGQSILKATVDVVKVDLNEKNKNTVLVNFNRKGLSLSSAALDPAIRATAYAFYSGKGETITHISVDIDENIKDVKLTTSTFRPEAMEGIRKMLYYVECGISRGAFHANPYPCKECKVCPTFSI